MHDAGDLRSWSERVQAARELDLAAGPRELGATQAPAELLARGVALSMFAARMREAFRDQARSQ